VETKAQRQLGINYPWVQLGWDFGVPLRDYQNRWVDYKGNPIGNPVPDAGPSPAPPQQKDRAGFYRLDEFLDCFQCLGIKVVRWVLFGDCFNFGRTHWEKQFKWKVSDVSLPLGFEADFIELLNRLQKRDMMLLPVLLLPSAFWPGYAVVVFHDGKKAPRRGLDTHPETWLQDVMKTPGLAKRAGQRTTYKGGRADILKARKKDFFDQTLSRLLTLTRDHERKTKKKAIYAWEVLTEPELALAVGRDLFSSKDQKVRDRIKNRGSIYWDAPHAYAQEPTALGTYEPEFTQADVVAFLRESGALVERYGFKWTVGFQFRDSVDDKSWEVATPANQNFVPQFHYYGYRSQAEANAATDRTMIAPTPFPGPNVSWQQKNVDRVVLGEFALADPPGNKNDPLWLLQPAHGGRKPVKTLKERVEAIKDAGFPMAFGWSARGYEPDLKDSGKTDHRSAWNDTVWKAFTKQTCSECMQTRLTEVLDVDSLRPALAGVTPSLVVPGADT
jgi:hypothetical protein